MSAYNPPESITPIFNPLLWPSNDDPYSQEQSNQRFVQTGNAIQTVNGSKRFTDLEITGTTPLEWYQSNGVVNGLQPPVTFWNSSFTLPSFSGPFTDVLVSRESQQTLLNKTLGTLRVAPTGTIFNHIQHGSNTSTTVAIAPQFTANITVTFPFSFASSPRVLVTNSVVGAGVGGLNFLLLTVRDITTTGCTIVCANTHPTFTFNGTIRADWVAWI